MGIASSLAALALAWPSIPAPAATVVRAPCPDSAAVACTARASATIYVSAGADAFAVEHERGHLFDAQRLDDGERAKLERLLGLPGRPWRSGTGLEGLLSPSERFADAYAACRLGLDPNGRWRTAYDYQPSRRTFMRTCATIARAAD